MKTYSFLYSDQAPVQALLWEGKLSPQQSYLIRIYTAGWEQGEAVEKAKEIAALLPKAQIIGVSTCGVIFHCEQYVEGTLVVIEEYEHTQIVSGILSWGGKDSASVVEELFTAVGERLPQLIHVVAGDHYYDAHNFAEDFNPRFPGVKMVGGVAGDVLPKDISAYVFTPDGVVENGLVFAALFGGELYTYTGVNVSHEAISTVHKMTKCKDEVWLEVNDIPIANWLEEQLGIESLKGYEDWQMIMDNDVLVRFPLILEGHEGASRFLKYDSHTAGVTQYFSRSPEGTEFRIGYVSPAECVRESFAICNEILEQPIESLFCYTCLFRRLYLHNCAEWEMSAYKGVNLCGAFMMGEFSYMEESNHLLNGSSCLVGVAENRVYIRPDMNVYEQLQRIGDDTQDLLNLVLKRQSERVNLYNAQLLDRLVEQQEISQKNLYQDYTTGIYNYLKYKEDIGFRAFDKLCMVKVENAELIITHSGHEGYQCILQKAVEQVRSFVQGMREYEQLCYYTFNESTFFVVADDRITRNHFMRICELLFENFRFLRIDESEDVLVSRFVVVLDQEDLIERALNTFQANRSIQAPFILCEPNEDERFTTEDEFRMIGVLNRALEGDGIVPYFQGIYDNHKRVISRYEALMRIVDLDGTVYLPAQFMSIAKKYHLYNALSSRMMDKVFALFQNSQEMVGINFSLHDINTEEAQRAFFEKLDRSGDVSNIVLEVLEDEEFRDTQLLKDFVARVREYGVKVAIDDFGSGYSNLVEIANIAPDYLKVDGSIIRSLHESEVNRRILDVIVYLGRNLDMEIVAEFVENAEIQKWVEFYGIRYSQGYYFSRPMPYERMEKIHDREGIKEC